MFPSDILTLFPLPDNKEVVRDFSLKGKNLKVSLLGSGNEIHQMFIYVNGNVALERIKVSKDVANYAYEDFIKEL